MAFDFSYFAGIFYQTLLTVSTWKKTFNKREKEFVLQSRLFNYENQIVKLNIVYISSNIN